MTTPSCAGSRILIVDDAPTNIQVLSSTLQEKGYLINVATNGQKALDILARIRPDLILLDVVMPDVDGFETCRRIKAAPDWRDIPIIFLTARSGTDDIVHGFELGAVDYVAKPFHVHELLARVHTHLAMDRLRRDNERLVREEAESARHRSVAQMVAGVAHEINTPLGIINTAADLITQRLSSPLMSALAETPEGKDLLDDLRTAGSLITRNVARADKLVQDFKKVSVNQITNVKEKVDLAQVVAQTVDLFRVTARQAKMEIEIANRIPHPLAEWHGYPGSLSQVLLNLLSNAQRYAYPGGAGGKVEITLDADAESFRMGVRDFGSGIRPEDLPRVFDPFFTTGRGAGGSGLGLAIVYNIVTALLKGTIAIESTPGQGTVVTITVPRIVID
jgi:signal transduction histidine kinase